MKLKRKILRFFNLRRIFSFGWLRFTLLVLTDPLLDYLNYYIKGERKLNKKKPVPRYAFHTLSWLEKKIKQGDIKKVVEWGAGNSTLWYAKMGCKVVAIEDNKKWADVLLEIINENTVSSIQLMYCQNKFEYINVPEDILTDADLIVIDGRNRVECALYIARLIKKKIIKNKIILFDDAQRDKYKLGIEILKSIAHNWEAFTGPIGVDLDHLTLAFII